MGSLSKSVCWLCIRWLVDGVLVISGAERVGGAVEAFWIGGCDLSGVVWFGLV